MSFLVISCRVMSCCVMSCDTMSCHVVSCPVKIVFSRHLWGHVLSRHVASGHVMPCHVVSCHVASCLGVDKSRVSLGSSSRVATGVTSCHDCHVMTCHVTSCDIVSCHVLSCAVGLSFRVPRESLTRVADKSRCQELLAGVVAKSSMPQSLTRVVDLPSYLLHSGSWVCLVFFFSIIRSCQALELFVGWYLQITSLTISLKKNHLVRLTSLGGGKLLHSKRVGMLSLKRLLFNHEDGSADERASSRPMPAHAAEGSQALPCVKAERIVTRCLQCNACRGLRGASRCSGRQQNRNDWRVAHVSSPYALHEGGGKNLYLYIGPSNQVRSPTS